MERTGYYVSRSQKGKLYNVVQVTGNVVGVTLATCERIGDATLIAKLLNQHEKIWMVRPEDIILPSP